MPHAGTQAPGEPVAAAPVQIRWTRGFRMRAVMSMTLLGIGSALSLVAAVGLALTMPGNSWLILVASGLGGLAVLVAGVLWAVPEWNGAALVLDDRALETRLTIRGRQRPWRIELDQIARVVLMRPRVLWMSRRGDRGQWSSWRATRWSSCAGGRFWAGCNRACRGG